VHVSFNAEIAARISRATLVALVGLIVAACLPDPFLDTCEAVIKQRLAAPSTYKRISTELSQRQMVKTEFERLEAERGPALTTGEFYRRAATRIALESSTPFEFALTIEYDASNYMGVPLRQRATCRHATLDASPGPTMLSDVIVDGRRGIDR